MHAFVVHGLPDVVVFHSFETWLAGTSTSQVAILQVRGQERADAPALAVALECLERRLRLIYAGSVELRVEDLAERVVQHCTRVVGGVRMRLPAAGLHHVGGQPAPEPRRRGHDGAVLRAARGRHAAVLVALELRVVAVALVEVEELVDGDLDRRRDVVVAKAHDLEEAGVIGDGVVPHSHHVARRRVWAPGGPAAAGAAVLVRIERVREPERRNVRVHQRHELLLEARRSRRRRAGCLLAVEVCVGHEFCDPDGRLGGRHRDAAKRVLERDRFAEVGVALGRIRPGARRGVVRIVLRVVAHAGARLVDHLLAVRDRVRQRDRAVPFRLERDVERVDLRRAAGPTVLVRVLLEVDLAGLLLPGRTRSSRRSAAAPA